MARDVEGGLTLRRGDDVRAARAHLEHLREDPEDERDDDLREERRHDGVCRNTKISVRNPLQCADSSFGSIPGSTSAASSSSSSDIIRSSEPPARRAPRSSRATAIDGRRAAAASEPREPPTPAPDGPDTDAADDARLRLAKNRGCGALRSIRRPIRQRSLRRLTRRDGEIFERARLLDGVACDAAPASGAATTARRKRSAAETRAPLLSRRFSAAG